MSIGWLIVGVVAGIIFCVISYLLSLATRKPDFEIDETEWDSGSVDVRRANKAQHDIDANRMREQFDNESDGA